MNKRGFFSALSLGSGTLFSLPAIAGIAAREPTPLRRIKGVIGAETVSFRNEGA